MAVLSKEWDWQRKHFLKISGGLFGMERYGLDVKWMFPNKFLVGTGCADRCNGFLFHGG